MRTVNSDNQNLVQMMVSPPPTSKMYHAQIEINVTLNHNVVFIANSLVCNLFVTDDTTEKNNLFPELH